MRNQQAAHLITDLNSIIWCVTCFAPSRSGIFRNEPTTLACRRWPAHASFASPMALIPYPAFELSLRPMKWKFIPLNWIWNPPSAPLLSGAQHLTGATGAAIALRAGDEIVCRARAGRTAPDLGVRLQTDAGISAEAVRSGEIMLCHDAERNPRVDLPVAVALESAQFSSPLCVTIAAPSGVFEVLSSSPGAFDESDVATMQLLSSMMVAAISRISSLHQAQVLRRAG